MKEMVNRMGVVHLGPVLEMMCENLGDFHKFLRAPRSLVSNPFVSSRNAFSDLTQQGPISTTVGPIMPLTLERYRILELLAELLHCSNMSLLNRPVEFHHLYDSEGRLQGGLSALEELASVIAMNASNDRSQDDISDEEESEVKPARDFPVRTVTQDSPSLDSDEDMDEPGSSDEEMEEIAMYEEPFSSSSIAAESPGASISVETASISSTGSSSSGGTISNSGSSPSTPMDGRPSRRQSMRSIGSRRSSRRRKDTMDQSIEVKLPIGEQLKKQFLEMNLFSTLLVSPLPFASTSG